MCACVLKQVGLIQRERESREREREGERRNSNGYGSVRNTDIDLKAHRQLTTTPQRTISMSTRICSSQRSVLSCLFYLTPHTAARVCACGVCLTYG